METNSSKRKYSFSQIIFKRSITLKDIRFKIIQHFSNCRTAHLLVSFPQLYNNLDKQQSQSRYLLERYTTVDDLCKCATFSIMYCNEKITSSRSVLIRSCFKLLPAIHKNGFTDFQLYPEGERPSLVMISQPLVKHPKPFAWCKLLRVKPHTITSVLRCRKCHEKFL